MLIAVMVAAAPVHAQDIVGLQDCGKASGVDRKLGCLQANAEFLHGLIRKNEAAAQARLREEAAKLADANGKLDRLRDEIARLKSSLDQIEKKHAKQP